MLIDCLLSCGYVLSTNPIGTEAQNLTTRMNKLKPLLSHIPVSKNPNTRCCDVLRRVRNCLYVAYVELL